MSAPEPGYAFPWEREAMQGAEMPDGLSLEDQLAYQAITMLYGRFRLKLVDRATGSAEKGKIGYELECRKRQADLHRKLLEWDIRLKKNVEGAINAYRKERTLENADRLVDIIDGFLRP